MKKTIQDSIQNALQRGWKDITATLGSIEDDVVERLDQAKKRIDPHGAGEEVQRMINDFGNKLQENSESLERKMEEGVRSMVGRVREPLADELANLRRRAEDLTKRVESQIKKSTDKEKNK